VSIDPWRPTAVETIIYEPDERAVIAVVPGAIWLTAGDIVELDDPPREARVLSSRLQLRRSEPARVLIVLDVPDSSSYQGDTSTTMLSDDIDQTAPTSTELDDELEKLTDEVVTDAASNDALPPKRSRPPSSNAGYLRFRRRERPRPRRDLVSGRSARCLESWP